MTPARRLLSGPILVIANNIAYHARVTVPCHVISCD
jgi:hypothetical protein